MYLFIILNINACVKDVEQVLSNENNGNKNARIRSNEFDSLAYYSNLNNPLRDIISYIKTGNNLPSTRAIKIGERTPSKQEMQQIAAAINPPVYPNYHCCNNICLTIPEDPYGFYAPFTDIWQNPIKFIGRYGNDPRQIYYVYIPNGVHANSKIVVLIHGGGWNSGPNPDYVNGWNATYTVGGNSNLSNQQNQNLVKNLLAQGFVVVAPLYRLVHYADTTTDVLANPITINDQINDIATAIEHIHANFPNCLWQTGAINANHIQVIGESAGAHLALMFAYTRANTSYVKSVIAVAAPSNMNQFANFIMNRPFTYSCGTDFVYDNINTTIFTHFPFYGIFDPNSPIAGITTTEFVNPPLMCTVANIRPSLFSFPNTWIPSSENTSKRVTNSYLLAQSCIREVTNTPLNNVNLSNISPSQQLNTARIVPTFIVHGTNDALVPYKFATNNMHNALINIGGMIDSCNSTGRSLLGNNTPILNRTIPTFYSSTAPFHLIKTYTYSNHDVSNTGPSASTIPTTTNGRSLVQLDILTWLNGH